MSQLKNMIRGAKPEVIILEQGTLILGREPGCDYLVLHPSVSTTHCEIRKDHGRVFIRDLGSTNGTFINDQPVKEAELQPDQIIRFGETAWLFQGTSLHVDASSDAPAGASVPAPAEAPWPLVPNLSISVDRKAKEAEAAALKDLPPVQRPCYKHPRVPAILICQNCRSEFCYECVNTRQTSKGKRYYCHHCNGRCEDIGAFERKQEEFALLRERRRNLFLCLGDIFLYPFRGWGPVILGSGTVMLAALVILGHLLRFMGPLSIITTFMGALAIFAYLVSYMQQVVQASANGDEQMPDWLDLSSWWDDIGIPTLHLIGTMLISFSPLLAYLIFTLFYSSPWIWIPLLILGLSYFPMAYLAVCVSRNLWTANPITVWYSISRVPLNYYLACIIFWGAYFTGFTIDVVLEFIPRTYWLLAVAIQILSIPVTLYLWIVEARVLGLIYYGNWDKLGWYDEKYSK
ncbi:MAG TPA: FHA domain-containing protein [Verrucomicrobiae bacterium]